MYAALRHHPHILPACLTLSFHASLHVIAYNLLSAGVGWVEVVEELGERVHRRKLLLVTQHTFALLDKAEATLVRFCWVSALVSSVDAHTHSHIYIWHTLMYTHTHTHTQGPSGYELTHVSHVEPGRPDRLLALGEENPRCGFVTLTMGSHEHRPHSPTPPPSVPAPAPAPAPALPSRGGGACNVGEAQSHDIVLMLPNEEEARRWAQILKRASFEVGGP